jgi:hypothetical protein
MLAFAYALLSLAWSAEWVQWFASEEMTDSRSRKCPYPFRSYRSETSKKLTSASLFLPALPRQAVRAHGTFPLVLSPPLYPTHTELLPILSICG